MFYVLLNMHYMRKTRHPRVLSLRTKSNFLAGVRTTRSLAVVYTSMDWECPIANVQPTLDDGATPSAEACDRRPATVVLLRVLRPASVVYPGIVLAGESFSPLKQLRRERGAYHNAEFETEHVVQLAGSQHPARHAASN